VSRRHGLDRVRSVAAFYDVHGNAPALEAALADALAEGVDRIVIGGDIATGPFPCETMAIIRSMPVPVTIVRGNADRELVNAARAQASDAADPWARRTRWSGEQLDQGELDLLAQLPLAVTIDIDGLGPVLFCHAAPDDDDLILTPLSDEIRVRRAIGDVSAAVIVCGHVHVQYERVVGPKRVVNAGSIGMPYEGRAGAYWALLGPAVAFRRTGYDHEAAARLVYATDFPGAAGYAREFVATSYPRDEALRQFEIMAAERENPRT